MSIWSDVDVLFRGDVSALLEYDLSDSDLAAVAAERKMPPSYVMPLRTIVALASQMPQTPEDLIAISGIGKKTAADHGPDLLEIVRKNM